MKSEFIKTVCLLGLALCTLPSAAHALPSGDPPGFGAGPAAAPPPPGSGAGSSAGSASSRKSVLGMFGEEADKVVASGLTYKEAIKTEAEFSETEDLDVRWMRGVSDYKSIELDDQGNPNPPTDEEKKKGAVGTAGEVPIAVNKTDVTSGMASAATDVDQVAVFRSHLKEPLTVYYSTLAQADGGIFLGANASDTRVLQLEQARYDAMQDLRGQFAGMGQEGSAAERNFAFCMAKRQEEGLDWYQASKLCMGDHHKEVGAAGHDDLKGNKAFSLADDPTYSDTENGDSEIRDNCGAVNGEKISLLSTRLFSIPKSASGATPNADEETFLQKLRTDFRTYIGDVCQIEKVKADDKVDNPFRSVRIAPVEPSQSTYPRTVVATYEGLRGLLYQYCIGALEGSSTDYVPFDPNSSKSFWRRLNPGALLPFSVNGYQMKPATLEIIYDFFDAKEPSERTAQTCQDRFQNPNDKLSNLVAGKDAIDTNGANLVRNEHRALFFVAKTIARLKLLDGYGNAELYLRQRAPNLQDATIKLGLKLLADVAGTDNITLSRQKSLADLHRFIEIMQRVGESYAGRRGAALAVAFPEKKANKAGATDAMSN